MINVPAQPVIKLNSTLTIGELTRYQYFHSLRRMWPLTALAVLLGSLSLLGLALSFRNPEPGSQLVTMNMVPLLLTVFALVFFPYRNARKIFSTQSELREPIGLTFTAEGIKGRSAGATWNLEWKAIKSVRETKSLFLLYHASNIVMVVPKRAFQNAAETDRWRALVASSVEAKLIKKPGVIGQFC